MYPLLTCAQMKTCDEYTINQKGVPSRILMERAARAALDVLLTHPAYHITAQSTVLVLCGSGNNGGDGFAMARFLLQELTCVTVAYAGAWLNDRPDESRMSEECARQYRLWTQSGGETLADLPRLDQQIVIDALLGIGAQGAPRAPMDVWIRAVNSSLCPVMAIDIPSGVNADNGRISENAIRAHVTVTIAAPKCGLLLYPGAQHAGEIKVCDIGIDTEGIVVDTALLCASDLSLLPPHPAYANKGIFGRVAVIGGAPGMCGAAYLAGLSAYRTGVGLVELVTWEENRIPLQTLLPEAVMNVFSSDASNIPQRLQATLELASAVVLGCGLGQSEQAKAIVAYVLRNCRTPLIVDADALNLIAADEQLQQLLANSPSAHTVITPHLGEAARLMAQPIWQIGRDLFDVCGTLSSRFNTVCVLKDTRTLISNGTHTYMQNCGNCGMATGGSGDCLAGVLGALFAALPHSDMISEEPTLLAALGVLLHARAGDLAAASKGQHGMIARDIADAIGSALREWEHTK